jgi:hypothetical protein
VESLTQAICRSLRLECMFERTCTFEGCQNRHRARGLCSSHLWQLDQGKELTPLRGPHGQKHESCTYPGCERKHKSNGWCHGHQTQLKRGQQLRPIMPKQSSYRWRTKQGYILVPAPEGHANAKKNGSIFEHVLVMTELLGRPLAKGETVHHRNNIKWDNRPENLELWHLHQPRGASLADTVAWARWFLRRYGELFPEDSR